MRISDLVRLRKNLLGIDAFQAKSAVENLDGLISQQFNIPVHSNYQDTLNTVIHSLDSIENRLTGVEDQIDSMIKQIDAELEEATKSYASGGVWIDGFFIPAGHSDLSFERNEKQLPVDDVTRAELIVKIRGHTDWHYPTLEIGPGDGHWTDHLVAGDPLYIVDVLPEFLESTLGRFNDHYRNRIRPYLTGMNVKHDPYNLDFLPQNQFGFVFSWNTFNYFPATETEAYLRSVYGVLRPGGTMIFSYNNCEDPICAEFVEKGYRSWMPKHLLVKICKDIGFNVVNLKDYPNQVYMIEIHKPGELKTVKTHQTLGKLINR